MFKRIIQQQQQQQHSLLSQASWGRLEVKPKKGQKKTEKELEESRKESKDHGSGTLIASLQALLSIAKSLEIFHSLRMQFKKLPIKIKMSNSSLIHYPFRSFYPTGKLHFSCSRF